MNIRMTTKGKRPLRSLTPSDKIHAIQRIHDGESKASVARDIGVPESTLRGWCKNEDKLRFMSRQSASDKMAADSLTDKLVDGAAAAAAALLGGPPEKRQKMDPSMPLNFSNKIKYEDLGYKRSPLNGLDFSTNKALSDLSFNGLGPDYNAFKNAEMVAMNGVKNKGYGADLSRQNDPSLAAISPLSSLSHLSGLTGLGHSPLAISFNELTSNLNLIAQLNPNLAATMSSLNGINPSSLRNVKPKPQPMHSPRSNDGDRITQGLSVKNWAKQKNSGNDNYGLNLSANDKNKMKCPSPSLAPSLGSGMPAMDDPLLYWLKSQQAMLGLNSLYPPNPISSSSPPIRSSTPQQHGHASTPPISSTPQTPTSTPSGSLDDKNSAWFNWCKAFGASLNSLAPHNALQPSSTTIDIKPQFENILYSHLTKESSSPHSTDAMNNNNNEVTSNSKPEDLSAKSVSAKTPSPAHSPIIKSEADTVSTHTSKDALDNLLYKMNQNNNNNNGPTANMKHEPSTDIVEDHDRELENNSSGSSIHNMQVGGGSESDASYNSDSLNNNDNHDNNNHNNNNNNSNKTDEEERAKYAASDFEDMEAIEHGEKFLKWLENCSNPRVTSVQLMQLRFLISAIKSGNEKQQAKDSDEENKVAKIRRRK
ncbi:protein distal antenna [Episyrphus balteatus]|uniref:protein distal antenna n=1 Tax=Episyrphus balteatus TaxID=286459 RepID=UPI00248620C3|nr:protein distal antenna [Episyrphus balteatus]XP_055851881.1 protein distal antenna [Episyrphus balteatus]XP_055851882.1 protein distal antenna [Episyrphus balteatus]